MVRFVVSLFVIILLLTGCTGGGGSNCSAGRSPSITSSPPLLATVGYPYQYHVDASYSCFPYVCRGVRGINLPPGATVSSSTVTWAPTSEYLNSNVSFNVATYPDSCGNSVSQSWEVKVIEAPSISSFTASRPGVNPGENVTLTAVFSNASGYIEGIGPVSSGVPVNTPTLNTTTSYTLVVQNAAGDEARETITIEVVQPPVITSLTVSRSVISLGEYTNLSWSASGDYSTATLEPLGEDVLHRNYLAIYPTTTTTYVLTLTNIVGNVATASVLVEVVPLPVINSFTSSETSTTFKGSVLLNADFENGTGEIAIEELTDTRTEVIQSNTPLDSGELLHTSHILLTVTNQLGVKVEKSLIVPITGPGTFSPSRGVSLYPTRRYHNALRLHDGRVFIAGGEDYSTGKNIATTELFDPVTETFSAGPDLIKARRNFGMAVLNDGRVLMVGGSGETGSYLNTAEIYDPGTNSITSAGAVNAVEMRNPKSVTLQDDRVLTVYTYLYYGSEIFDPLTELFSKAATPNMTHPTTNLNLLKDGRVLAIDNRPYSEPDFRESELYYPTTNKFIRAGSVSSFRNSIFSSLTLIDGRVIIVGGGNPSIDSYNPITSTFEEIGMQQYPAIHDGSITQLSNGLVLITGAEYAAELFDPLTNTTSITGGMSNIRNWHYTSTLLEDGRVLIIGGCISPCEAEIYTP